MKLLRCGFSGQSFLIACGIVALASIAAHAQTPPRPAVQVRQLPDLWHNVWPGDFNRDGRTDLVAARLERPLPGGIGRIAVRLGNGNGTFGSAIVTAVNAKPLTTGHFDSDGMLDVVVVTHDGIVSVLPGNGDGTLGAAHRVDDVDEVTFGLGGDLNGDGIRDLVVGHEGGVDVHPGLGNFAFGPKITLPSGTDVRVSAGIMVDLNGDGRRDLAVAQGRAYVSIYLNRGGFLFDASEILILHDFLWAITAGDLDRDGDQDLVVTHSDIFLDWTAGGVEILRGNGNGTFAAPVQYQGGVDGPLSVVVGHFNGDGLLDVATGNQSWIYVDQNGPTRHYWDSVSIFPGRGDGRLAPAATFRLDTVNAGDAPDCDFASSCYVFSHHSLKISDVNADGRMDIITSPGAVLLNRAAAANRPPLADAGPDTVLGTDFTARLSVKIAEPDWDWLRVEWREASSGALVSHVPSFFYSPAEDIDQDHTLRVTVSDVRGGVATDTVVVRQAPRVTIIRPIGKVQAGAPTEIRWSAFDAAGFREFDVFFASSSAGFAPIAECTNLPGSARSCIWRNPNPIGPGEIKVVATDNTGIQGVAIEFVDIVSDASGPGGIPPGWDCGAAGAVAINGQCSHSSGVFTIKGSGAGIGGTADEFQFLRYDMTGNFSMTARVRSVQNVNQRTQAGIMIRDWVAVNGGDRHASFLVTPTTVNGTVFQRRTSVDGPTISSAGPVTTAPIWLKLVRSGNTIRAFYRKTITNGWTLFGSQMFAALPERLSPLLVVSSHVDGTLATGVFDNVVIDQTESVQSIDIGGSAAGTTQNDGATVTMQGNGAGIWGTSDAFRFRYTQWTGDGTITARLRSLENTSSGAKAGVMFRESLVPGSKHVMGAVYAAGGVVLQTRTATGGTSTEVARRPGTAPEWLRLTRAGSTFTVAASNDGVTWAAVGQTTVTMRSIIYVGLPVTSRVAGTLATAILDDVVIEP